MEKKQSRPMKLLNAIVSEPYYLLHFLTFFSYLVLRTSAAHVLSAHITDHLLHREIRAALTFGLLTAIKVWNFSTSALQLEENPQGFIADSLFSAKVIYLFVSDFSFRSHLILDRHLTLWYVVAFIMIHIFTQQPAFQKLGTSSKLTPLQLESLLTEGSTSKHWLIEFRASYSPACIRSSRCFPDFGWSMGQLPTYVLFTNGAEVARYPPLESQAKAFRDHVTKKFLWWHFKLDKHLLEYINGK
ncbi:thioredoxin-related transmembrane protein 2-like [Pyrus ussuriensis x Pyrus communis]|uniref:Thioredoxin-related transmembrane protein 2-like n=1 Tax=Pyrus ussuriensis x Pyrus communis TaxID=2448454 RepID=A0A5N5HS25_9ROSA|nr:thioredoxin-related transmembrane protein 2-like [Pyrus ussuriensis x Pyrus communis]